MQLETIGLISLAVVGAFVFLSRRTPPTDLGDPNKILAEVDVLLAYGREKQAIALLEAARKRHGGDPRIAGKLRELRIRSS